LRFRGATGSVAAMGPIFDTIAALATPVGTSALAVVRASGPVCGPLVETILGRPPSPRLAVHTDYRDLAGRLIDDVVVTFFQGPNSYTGEDALEVSCHGNPFVAQTLLEDLWRRGCRPAEPGEFTRRAFLNGRLDLSQAEAVMDVIHARSERALAAAQRQLRGALGEHLARLTDALLQALAQIEAYIDFPEEDLPPEDRRRVSGEIADVLRGTQRLLATQHYGEVLRDGLKTVIVGEPNAGKSSLLNRLVGRERAIVSELPGTTRDFLEERLIVGPHCLRLIDTAGLNPAPERLERLGMDKTLERLEEADLVLLVVDASKSWPGLPTDLPEKSTLDRWIMVENKTDLLGERSTPPPPSPWTGLPRVAISALTGKGMDELTDLIVGKADAFGADVGEDGVAINARHADALRRAGDGLAAAAAKLPENAPLELVASDLRDALDAYGEIGGRIDNEQMLDRLFAAFCIGK
jgi:tRNA modification GTPase